LGTFLSKSKISSALAFLFLSASSSKVTTVLVGKESISQESS
jgi:hypothetical protein